jgi:uncharacterized repeat protein (TIGR03803 family)
MSCKKFLGAASAALTIVIAFTLVLAPAAGAASKYKVLRAFNGSDGSTPYAGLIFDSAGNLYGTTVGGGVDINGNVFKLTPNADGSWAENVLHTFNGSDGAEPFAGLVFDAAGNLYGTTGSGGADNFGTVFKLTPNADGRWTESVLYSFNNRDGRGPYAELIFDAAGNLYGTTAFGGNLTSSVCIGYGCGVVFKLTPNTDGSWTERVLHTFNGSDGAEPIAGLIFDTAGNLYGMTDDGGDLSACGGYGCGVVFKLTPNADGRWTESVLHSFNNRDGANPYAGLIFDAVGNLYGTTQGGAYGNGTVFKLTPKTDGSWTESVLHSFSIDLGVPLAALIFDGAGNLYGTASSGGPADGGAAFKLSPNQDGSWAYSLLHVFQGDPALAPYSGLVFGSAGTLYGSTAYCSSSSGCAGVIYQITP